MILFYWTYSNATQLITSIYFEVNCQSVVFCKDLTKWIILTFIIWKKFLLTWQYFEINFELLFNNSSWLGYLTILSFFYQDTDFRINHFKDDICPWYLPFISHLHFERLVLFAFYSVVEQCLWVIISLFEVYSCCF